MIDRKVIEFVKKNKQINVQKLILSSDKYPGIDVKLAATLISAKQKIEKKIPDWSYNHDLYFPNSLSVEQASSQFTAQYKKRFVEGGIVVDLTGGLGVDSYYFSQKADSLFYFEKNKEICDSVKYNFECLRIRNVLVSNSEITNDNIDHLLPREANLIYLDPSRRDTNNNRVYSIIDYKPNILELKDKLFSVTEKILIKVSPMVDISATLDKLNCISEVHVLSVHNECKELLFLLNKPDDLYLKEANKTRVFTVNFSKEGRPELFDYYFEDEGIITSNITDEEIFTYIYEPNTSILKAGAFKSLGLFLNLKKLHKHTHLYSSDSIIDSFPGRIFKVKSQLTYNKGNIKSLKDSFPKANISTRNFPLSPEELKKTLKIKDGGDVYIFGCTLNSGARKLLVCSKVI